MLFRNNGNSVYGIPGEQKVTQTQLQQLSVILIGMVFIFVYMIYSLPPTVQFSNAMEIAGWEGQNNALSFN